MTAPRQKIANLDEALTRFNEILAWSRYRFDGHPYRKWVCPVRYFEPEFIETITKRHGPEQLEIVGDEPRDVVIPVWAIADMILDTQLKLSLPPEAIGVDAPYPSLGNTIQTAYDYHRYFAGLAEENVRRERAELRRAQTASSEAESALLPDTRIPPVRDELCHPLIDQGQVLLAKDALSNSGSCDKGRAAALNRLVNSPTRILRRPERRDLKVLNDIEADFPHFQGVLNELRLQLRLQIAARAPLVFRPLLMVGAPGIGKTAFMRRLGEGLNLTLLPVSAGTATASWVLKGTHSGWRAAAMGAVAGAVLNLKARQGLLLMIDEVDKQPKGNFPIEPVLLELLEPEQNRHFEDEFLGVEMNLQPLLSVVLTANKLEPISAPLLSRTTTVEVSYPTPDQMPAVLRSVDRELRHELPGLGRVFRALPDEAVKELGSVSLREARATLMRAYGRALERPGRGRRQLAPEDVRASRPRQMPKAAATASNADVTVEDLLRLVLVRSLPPTGGAPPGTILH